MNVPLSKFLLILLLFLFCRTSHAQVWTKHEIVAGGHCNTAVALQVNQDEKQDVIASFGGKVSLFIAPEWQEVVIHRFDRPRLACIHSAVLDVDGDGDLDWAGAIANQHPFWLENPGKDAGLGAWAARPIDHDITGIHCLRAADVDLDGKLDLIINNFEPERGLRDSIAWLEVPKNPRQAEHWIRHVFADGDARGGSHYMGAGDVTGDGWPDIAVGAKGGPFADGDWFAFWTNPGPKKKDQPWKKTVLATEQIAATNILPADVNGDGKLDWLATRGHSAGVLWFESPSWTLHEIDPEIKQPHSLTVADHDGDGDMDAASCGYGSEWLRWYENDGKGNFRIHTLDEQQQSYHLSTVDMDGDGDLDLLNAGRGTGNIVWYENGLR
ncbi:MAG: VCBS repeat-containing protein [Planctomycetota bacterium]|nr:VCBS repeat-containing protein [Planctomycetota bacterium]